MNAIVQQPKSTVVKLFPLNGNFPNNPKLPLVIYDQALKLPPDGAPDEIEKLIQSNGWGNSWRWGLYDYHHYHSTAHECLCIYRGTVTVQFGGEKGFKVVAEAGDVVILPAGLCHRNIQCSPRFRTVGCYPAGQTPDMKYGKPGERPAADRAIAAVPLPKLDPVYGKIGSLLKHWKTLT
ncbi:cupin domain-containing protein [Pontiella desulfatans]|nr:cupin domain-containing protein [Pontiella desulfatans]